MTFFSFFRNFVILIFSVFLFAIGLPQTSWFVFVPVLFLVEYSSWKNVWLYGGIYGFFSYFFYVTWLFKYSQVAMLAVCIFYFFIWAFLFVILKFFQQKTEKLSGIFQWFILILYEYLKTKGFLGFSYGVNGYNQWKNIYLIQIADTFGVFGVSALLSLSSVVVWSVIRDFIKWKNGENLKKVSNSSIFEVCLFAIFLVSSYGYGFFRIKKTDLISLNSQKVKVVALQNNTDPWKDSFEDYKTDVQNLIELTEQALSKNPDTDFVIWPETSVVPSIMNNYYLFHEEKRYALITSLLEYINTKNCAFILGNSGYTSEGDFNSALVFFPKENVIPPNPLQYNKIHLVPFAEYFPFEKQLPFLANLLLESGSHFWTPGKERTVFKYRNLSFSVPICFEDTFGKDCKLFYKNGARAFFNMSNDAWAGSLRCQNQHLQMAVFRSVENHIPSVRSTASGFTCIIDSCGRIVEISKPFEQNYVVGQIPILK